MNAVIMRQSSTSKTINNQFSLAVPHTSTFERLATRITSPSSSSWDTTSLRVAKRLIYSFQHQDRGSSLQFGVRSWIQWVHYYVSVVKKSSPSCVSNGRKRCVLSCCSTLAHFSKTQYSRIQLEEAFIRHSLVQSEQWVHFCVIGVVKTSSPSFESSRNYAFWIAAPHRLIFQRLNTRVVTFSSPSRDTTSFCMLKGAVYLATGNKSPFSAAPHPPSFEGLTIE